MKARCLLLSLSLILAAFSARAMTVTTNLFVETFSTATGYWSGTSKFEKTDRNWTSDGKVFGATGGAKLGTSQLTGTITSDMIPLRQANTAANLSIYVQAAAYSNQTGQLLLTAFDENNVSLASWTTNLVAADVSTPTDLSDMESAASFDFTFDFTTLVPFKLAITTGGGDKRVLVGEVRVSQTYDDGRIQLATPEVMVYPAVNALGLFFMRDANATGYEVKVLDPHGTEVGTVEFDPGGMGIIVNDLEEGTSYTVRLRAVGDGVVYASSEWYEEQISTTVDNSRPVWTIGTPDPVPTIGRAFSFGVSAALANGTPQTVAFDGLTPVPTGAQPTFADGVFTWTPGEGAAGSYTAAFSVGNYATNVEFRVRGSTEETILFWEDFPNFDNAWSSTVAVDLPTTDTRVSGWSGANLYKARSAMKLGKANAADYGTATTPMIEIVSGASATVKLTLDAAAYNNKTGTLGITAIDATSSAVLFSSNVVLTAMTNSTLTSISNYPVGPFSFTAEGRFTISFAPISGDGRMGIDSVKVTQQVSTSLEDLGAPADLAVVGGTLSTNSFSVAWSPVANATNYAVEVYVTGETVALATMDFAAPPAALAGLSDDTDYTVRVRAEGDTERYNYSPWASVSARTLRSALNPTLTVGPWSNAAGEDRLYGVIRNTAAVSAELDDHTPVDVVLADIAPAPSRSPALADGTLSWTPAEADEGTTFTLTFAMTPAAGVVYETNVSFKVQSLPDLRAPVVTFAEPVDWNRIVLSWDVQYRATRYGVRVWTGGPNPDATATRVEEHFERWPTNRPFGWTFGVKKSDEVYSGTAAPVKLSEDGHFMETYDLGGTVSSVSFHAVGHSMTGGSTLSVVGIAEDETETPLGTVSDLGSVQSGTNCTFAVPAGAGVRRVAWRYAKINGGVGVGTVVIEGTGFATAKFLPGWGPTEKNVGLVQSCTVAKPRPGRYLGVNPANKKEDLTEPCVNYAEVQVRDAAGTTFATIVAVPVPAPPRSARATLMILK